MSVAATRHGAGRRRRHRRGINWTLGLIVVAAIVALQGVMTLVWVHEEFIGRAQAFADAALERALAMHTVVETTEEPLRGRLLGALADAHTTTSLTPAPATAEAPEWRHADRVYPHLDLAALPARTEVRIVEGAEARRRGPPAELLVSVPTRDGWLNVAFRIDPGASAGLRVVTWAVLLALLVVGLALLAVRHATRPLRLLAAAAERLGRDPDAPPVEARGGREVALAVRSFNEMQRRLRALLDDRRRMLGALSHDLRTQLTRLRLRLETLPDPEQRRLATVEMDTMQAMVDGALAFARDDAADESPRDLDLAALLATLCDEREDLGEAVSFEGPGRLRLRGRPVALRRAFDNLIGNAVRYGGGAEVRLAEAGASARVTIADRGPGIPAAERTRVLEPFVRLDPSRSGETGGAGLGLAVAAGAIRLHGGDLAFDDRQGGGLLATVTLPLVDPSASAGEEGEAPR
jgi:signal transduction histidine kinase